ncbi:uncharacterized protein TNCV_3375581 [Trichonephila clavipes]|nr:uncharacterized protein TNCV_3375581 [Trichonephila clavipes]
MLLQPFKLTAEKFWELFSRHRKSPNGTWKDYYFEIRSYFEGWLNELKIESFDGLKNLMIADQMKKRCSPECKEHYLDIWEELISPEMLVPNERSPLRCYGCGKQGVLKSRCPTCNLNASQRTDVATIHINAYTAQTRSPRLTLIDITFCGIKGRETPLAMSLADGQQTAGEALTTQEQSLLQGEDKEEHPVEFASRLLNPAERNYSTTEREALAVVWALNKFRGYIDGASITVASDHQPLRWLMKLKSPLED